MNIYDKIPSIQWLAAYILVMRHSSAQISKFSYLTKVCKMPAVGTYESHSKHGEIQAYPGQYFKLIWRKFSPFSATGICSVDSLLLNSHWWISEFLLPPYNAVTHWPHTFSAAWTVLLLFCWIHSSPTTRNWEASSLKRAERQLLFPFVYSCLNHKVIALFLLCSIHYAGSAAC